MKSAPRALQATACFLLVVLFAACHGDGSTGVGPASTGVHAILGADVTDTVDAQLTQALVVEVRGLDGKLVPGVVVRFETPQNTNPGQGFGGARVNLCALTAAYCGGYFVADTTDSRGRASALIRLRSVTGKAVVTFTVPDLGLLDSASYTVVAGAPAHVRAAATDTALDIGATATLSGHVTDRYYNPRPEVPTTSLGTGSALTLDASKNTVTGTAMGTQWVYAKFGSFVDSTSVRVIPPGRLVVWAAYAREIRLVNTNGSNDITLTRNVSSDLGAIPHFDPSRQHVTLHAGTASYGGPPTNIAVVDTGSLVRQDLTPGFTTIVTVRQQGDGSLLVVGQRTTGGGFSLWKVGTDNSVTEVANLPDMTGRYDGADIARDGTHVAYIASPAGGATELRVMDVAVSGTYTVLANGVLSPRFSPQGDRVAFLVPANSYGTADGTLSVIDVSGSNRRSLGTFVFSPGLAWSPDGTYLVGRNSDFVIGPAMRMLRVSDGANVLLRFGTSNTRADYYQADWR